MHRYHSLVLFALVGWCVRAFAADAIDVDELKKAYAANNQNDVPVVSWMTWGMPKFVLYADAEIIVPNSRSKSKLGKSRLSAEAFRAALAKIEAQDSFWALSPNYSLTSWSEQPLNIVSVRLPQKKAIQVSVYGLLTARSKKDASAPEAFVSCIDVLKSLVPQDSVPWDPGYVEIGWADYGYAPDRSLPWPKEWPGLEGPLARPARNSVTKWFVLFPSSRVDELDAFLAQRLERGAILVDGKKVSGSYRWPLRGEKHWTSWSQ